jgi:hypothetical protein
MDRIRVIASFVALSLLVVWGDSWMARPSAEGKRSPAEFPTTAVFDPVVGERRTTDVTPPKVDVLGNEIQDAVGDYRVDRQGEIYERHSPDTEVKKLHSAIG